MGRCRRNRRKERRRRRGMQGMRYSHHRPFSLGGCGSRTPFLHRLCSGSGQTLRSVPGPPNPSPQRVCDVGVDTAPDDHTDADRPDRGPGELMAIHRYSILTSARSPAGASPVSFSARASQDIPHAIMHQALRARRRTLAPSRNFSDAHYVVRLRA